MNNLLIKLEEMWLYMHQVFNFRWRRSLYWFKRQNGICKSIENLNQNNGLDLILHTPGGSISDTESIIDYLNSSFNGNIRAIIPQMATSGGTMITCSCK